MIRKVKKRKTLTKTIKQWKGIFILKKEKRSKKLIGKALKKKKKKMRKADAKNLMNKEIYSKNKIMKRFYQEYL